MTREHGAASLEYLGMLSLFLFTLAICFEVYVSFSTIEKVEDAARTGARVGSMKGPEQGRRAAENVMPGWLNQHAVRVEERDNRVECEIWAKVPVLFKGIDFDIETTRRVEMPVGG